MYQKSLNSSTCEVRDGNLSVKEIAAQLERHHSPVSQIVTTPNYCTFNIVATVTMVKFFNVLVGK